MAKHRRDDGVGSLGVKDRNRRYVEKGAPGQWPMPPAGESGRHQAHGLERPTHRERRHGDSLQLIPHSAGRGADDAGVTDPILGIRDHVVEVHAELAIGEGCSLPVR